MAAQAVGQQYQSKVELRFECRNLLNKDIMSKSDPCAVVFMSRRGGFMEEIGRTENVKNSLDPKFSKSFMTSYFFEEVQKVKIAVYDLDNTTPTLYDDDFLGQVETTLGELVSNSPCVKPLLLKNGQKAGSGTITITAEEVKEGSETAVISFKAKKLENKDFMGKSDPFLEILRPAANGSWQVVHRTEVIKNELNPTWRPVEIRVHSLCQGNHTQQIRLDVYDWDSDGQSDLIGGCTTTLQDMLKAAQQEVTLALVNAKKSKKKGYTNSGFLLISSCKLVKELSFLEFIFGGMQINFTVGVDFTASNGDPKNPSSLHYFNPYQPNEYMQAIRAVGDVCQDYDTDKLFPALGFGAKLLPNAQLPPNVVASFNMFEFALNFNMNNPFCAGIDGVLQAYSACLQNIQLYGPTNVTPIIQHVARFAASAQREESSKGAHAYFILLLLTDGALSDMSNVKQAIVDASTLPMSLIIVGVGSADFAAMNELDGDNGVLRAPNGQPVKRDIVQFVPFREFKQANPAELARHVLAEVPKQVVDYYKMRGMKPNPKRETPTILPGTPAVSSGAPTVLQGGPQQWQGQAPLQPGAPYSQAGVPPSQPGAQYPQAGVPSSQPGAPYPQAGVPPSQPGAQYPQAGVPPSQPGAPYPQAGVPPSQPGAQYPQAGASPSQPGVPYPQAGVPHSQPGAQYPQAGVPSSQPGAQYPQAGGQPQWQGAPPGNQPQWQGVPPSSQPQWQGASSGGQSQWQGAPPISQPQWQGVPPGGQSHVAPPINQTQWQGAPPGGQPQWQGTQPGGQPQWQGAPTSNQPQGQGATAGGQSQWQGAPPSNQPQWQGVPPGGQSQWQGAPPGNLPQWQGAPSGGQPQWPSQPGGASQHK